MISKIEYEGYKEIVQSNETRDIMTSQSPDEISKLGSTFSIYYARLATEYADIKDEMDREYLRLVKPVEDGGEGCKVTAAEKIAEVNVNNKYEVTRRQIENLMAALDKISFAASARCRSFSKEGSF